MGRRIYVSSDVSQSKLSIVLGHEREHISLRHYIDLAFMETFTLLLWFDPFIWIVRRELRSIHEFEADQGTLESGVPMKDYMLAILEDTAGVILSLANGLRSSITKKRFLKMKTPVKIRMRALRVALTVPFAAALFLFFAFRPAPPRHVVATGSQSKPDTETSAGKQFGQPFSHPFTTKDFPSKDYSRYGLSVGKDGTLLGVDGYPVAETEIDYFNRFDGMLLDPAKMVFYDGMPRNGQRLNPMHIVSIERNKTETRITRVQPVYSNWYWVFWGNDTCLVDPQSGDRYMIRDIEGDQQVGRLGIIRGYMGKVVLQTLVFPPLDENIKTVNFFEPESFEAVPIEWSSGETRYDGIVLDNYAVEPQGRVIR